MDCARDETRATAATLQHGEEWLREHGQETIQRLSDEIAELKYICAMWQRLLRDLAISEIRRKHRARDL